MELICHHFESIPSTNDWIKAHLKTLSKERLLLVTAKGQTAARGQHGRKWHSPPGENIYASFGLIVEASHDPLSLTHLLAISTVRVLQKYQVECHIKWPNDLLVNKKKIGGILCETEHSSLGWGLALGIGLNVNMEQSTLSLIDQPATSLQMETGCKHHLQQILSDLTHNFVTDLQIFFQKGFEPFMALFSKLCMHVELSND